jgi:hypothetical protein
MSSLIEQARAWVSDNYAYNANHLLRAQEWLLRLKPGASEALILATLTHDMERAFPGPDSPQEDLTRGVDDPVYNRAHAERSARVVSTFLRAQGASEALIADVARLVRAHEEGGWPDADLVQAADSLSFLEVNVDLFLSWIPTGRNGWTSDHVRAKFDWMYQRISVQTARTLATPLYHAAIHKVDACREGR